MRARCRSAPTSHGRRTTALDIATQTLARVAAYALIQPEVFIHRSNDGEVLRQARAVDARSAAGAYLPLAGVPFAVMDYIDVEGHADDRCVPGIRVSSGALQRKCATTDRCRSDMPGQDQPRPVRHQVWSARAVPYGAPRCVFNRDYISGGSSSGSAVAVAAGLVPFALGTDTAGLRPRTRSVQRTDRDEADQGPWSTQGLVPACRSLDCISVFTANVADAALIDEVVAGFDAGDPYSRAPRTAAALPEIFRFGVPRPEQLQFFGDQISARLYQDALGRMVAAGGTPVEVDIAPLLKAAQLLYAGPWVAERTAAIEDFLRKCPGASIRWCARSSPQASAPRGYRRSAANTNCRPLARQAEALWSSIDALVLPTAATIYRLAEVLAEPVALNSNLGLYTNFVNLLDMSAVAIPAGFRDNHTGFGITLIGAAFMDRPLLTLAQRYLESGCAVRAPAARSRATRCRGRSSGGRRAPVGHAPALAAELTPRAPGRDNSYIGQLSAVCDGQCDAPKPALIHTGGSGAGAPIAVEVYELGMTEFGSFVAEIPPPLAIGSVELGDGTLVKGFIARTARHRGRR